MYGTWGDDVAVAAPASLDTATTPVLAAAAQTDSAAVITSPYVSTASTTTGADVIAPPIDVHYIGPSRVIATPAWAPYGVSTVTPLVDMSRLHPAVRNGERRLPGERGQGQGKGKKNVPLYRRPGANLVGKLALAGVVVGVLIYLNRKRT